MSACQAEMSENIKKDHPYGRKQWQCMIDWVNAFLDCGRAGGCGDFSPIPDVSEPCIWVVEKVHETLAQIRPEIMGEVPQLWSRKWLDKVVETLKAGWPGCEDDLKFELLFEHEIIPSIEPWNGRIVSGSCGDMPTIAFDQQNASNFAGLEQVPDTIFNRRAFPQSKYVEWRHLAYYTAAGLDIGHHMGLIGGDFNSQYPTFQSEISDKSEWFSFTQQKMVEFDELCEDDFYFTAEEFSTQQEINRYPQSIQAHNAAILAAMAIMRNEPTQEASVLMLEFAPYATKYDYITLISPYQGERGSWGYPPGAYGPSLIDINVPEETAVRVPTQFKFDDLEYEKMLAAQAQYLWALRWKHLCHVDALQNWDAAYSYPFLPNTGLSPGTQNIWKSISAGRVILHQHGVFASQWSIGGQELRTDIGQNPRTWFATHVVHRPLYSPCSGLLSTGGSNLPQKSQIGVVKASGGFIPPECADEWHY